MINPLLNREPHRFLCPTFEIVVIVVLSLLGIRIRLTPLPCAVGGETDVFVVFVLPISTLLCLSCPPAEGKHTCCMG